MQDYQQRRKMEIEKNRKDEAKNLLMDQNLKNRLSENASAEYEKYRNNCAKWTSEEWPRLTKEEQQWYKDEAAKRWPGARLDHKRATFTIFRLLGGCPYNVSSWVAENWDKGNDWLVEHAEERPKTYYKDGYCYPVGHRLVDRSNPFQTWESMKN